ncbi:L-histidine N(alpha)-methyltransferase [Antribacter sp. KLBMP9083]|uniref:L-histidine N(Alpha)-methyltransferase n=1 Tax=Antribacter soli TaxID=2910976 RepID=A0AA41U8Z1_9MICO|nr:L-histidine N(alpha)-methyltransferase [Antribacter soli]MCF4123241.1 L-histidine N(alpha)-methyltransferase [Antribacter soli]
MGESVIKRLEQALAGDEFAWSLLLVGEDQSDKLSTLSSALRGDFSATGDGKAIPSGFAYWGIGPTIAWINASKDPYYLVIKVGTEMFLRQWRQIRVDGGIAQDCVHLVSLGVGTGLKDRVILEDMYRNNPSMYYVPVDMSAEMLRIGMQEAVRGGSFPDARALSIQLDLSMPSNVEELRDLLARLVGEEPILFSLTGNTAANFEADHEFLGGLTRLLRPQDRLLLEVASTERLDDRVARAAADEYMQTRAFTEFVTSALRYNTDLKVNYDHVKFVGAVDEDALLVKMFWQNETEAAIRLAIPGQLGVNLHPSDTIRLLTTRKYTPESVERLITAAGLATVAVVREQFRHMRGVNPFGLDMRLLKRNGDGDVGRHSPFEIWT